MPELCDISYSEDECVAAIRDYYDFISKMYLDRSVIMEPPEGGWPMITPEIMEELGKSDKVTSLLRRLPYIREPGNDFERIQVSARCAFSDWVDQVQELIAGRTDGDDVRGDTEGEDMPDDVPAHVIGLTSGTDSPIFLLDTELGIVNWYECPGELYQSDPSREPIQDDPYDYAAENEAEWRAEGAAWAIPDFFELLKDQFRELRFVPTGPRKVHDSLVHRGPLAEGMLPTLQDIYREHGWPDLEHYRKEDCLEAVRKALEEKFPDFVE